MKQKLSIMLITKVLICVVISSILTTIIVNGFNNYENFMNTVIRAELFVILGSILFIINEFFCILGLKYVYNLFAVIVVSKQLNNNFTEVATRNVFLKSFEEFIKDFNADFTGLYTAEARMCFTDIIYLRIKDNNGTVKDYKTISAVDFLKYFKTI
ncbi:MAG: hypothetical protein IJN50_01880 [Clostridia bacterium]|nr:hypothetical protein [Clostridiales bacterium]MBQ6991656.1 hypothetical protein [Clostridia bacterium]